MANKNYVRGYQLEAETVRHWEALGLECSRVVGSGKFKRYGKQYAGDLMLAGFSVEAKRKKSGFKFLRKSLAQDDCDMLVIREDAQPGEKVERLYVMPEKTVEAIFRQLGLIKL